MFCSQRLARSFSPIRSSSTRPAGVPGFLAGLLLAGVLFAGDAGAIILYGHGDGDDTLYRIDSQSLATTPVGTSIAGRRGPEIEAEPQGATVLLSQLNDGAGAIPNALLSIDAATGLDAGSVTLSGFPDDHNVVTSLEFVGSTLFATTTVIGPELDSDLVTVDPSTGVITPVGDTGLANPVTGMTWDPGSGTLYGITGTSDLVNHFVSIDTTTGLGTVLFALPDTDPGDGDLGGAWTGLTLGSDGLFYAVANRGPESLYQIDAVSGDVTELGDLGVSIVSLATPIPEPGSAGLVGSALLALAAVQRHTRRRRAGPVRSRPRGRTPIQPLPSSRRPRVR